VLVVQSSSEQDAVCDARISREAAATAASADALNLRMQAPRMK
jgi:hypothetical protein